MSEYYYILDNTEVAERRLVACQKQGGWTRSGLGLANTYDYYYYCKKFRLII